VTEIRLATAQDRATIDALLISSGLPIADLDVAQPLFVVAHDGPAVLGVAALERFGATALVRSVAVASHARHRGLGHALVKRLEEQACREGLIELVLLTETAKTFFEKEGYSVIDRASAPEPVRTSAEFRTLCPQSATCLSKRL
jgi:amino-acid N-acetyltransferase